MAKRVFLNEDWIHFGYITFEGGKTPDEKWATEYIRQYADSEVTDFLLNVNGTVSSSESVVLETWSDKYEKTVENGVPVDFRDTLAWTYHELHERKIDLYGLWIGELRKMGIRPWLSFRMNDVHGDCDGKASLRKAEMVEAHPSWWISRDDVWEGKAYFDRAFDYSIPEVRDLYYRYIKEQLTRYDVDGIELDFTREPYCFPAGKETEGIPVMLDFVRDIRRLADEIGDGRGHRLEIAVLCPASPIQARKMGLDIPEMAKRGYVDVVAAAPRWESINNDIPVQIWKQLLGERVAFGGVQELLVNGSRDYAKSRMINADMAYGQAHAFLSRGADILYLFNYFFGAINEEKRWRYPSSIKDESTARKVIRNITRPQSFDRRYPLTFDDFMPYGCNVCSQLPARTDESCCLSLRIPVGREEQTKETYLIFSTKEAADPEKMRVTVNGTSAAYCRESRADVHITPENAYTFRFSCPLSEEAVVRVGSAEGITVDYAEILVRAAE